MHWLLAFLSEIGSGDASVATQLLKKLTDKGTQQKDAIINAIASMNTKNEAIFTALNNIILAAVIHFAQKINL